MGNAGLRARGRAFALAAVVAALLAASPAQATTISETPPNDNIAQAFGPLASGVTYDGQFETTNDRDWLTFFVGGAQQVTVRVTKVGTGCSSSIGAALRDRFGQIVNYEYDNSIESNTTTQFDMTTTTAGRFYVNLASDCVGDPYQVDVGPPEAITTVAPAGDEPSVPSPQPIAEPNDTIASAFGPLAPSTSYGGDFATVNDHDWLVFYTTGAVQTRVYVTKVGAGCSESIGASVRNADGAIVNYEYDNSIESNTTAAFDFATSAAGRFYVSLGDDCAGDPYQVRVGPPEAITVSSPLAAFAPTTTPVATAEPNDTVGQATRIKGGIAYGGAIDTVNDIDLLRFVVTGGRQVDVAVTKIGDGCGTGLDTSVFKAATPSVTFSSRQTVERNETTHHQFTSQGTVEYVLRISGSCAGDPYQVRIDPADAVGSDGDGDGVPDGADRCPTVAGSAANGCPAKVAPRSMTLRLTPSRDRTLPLRFRASGRLGLPAGVSTSACGGKVTVRVRSASRIVSSAVVVLRRDCTYARTVVLRTRRAFRRARSLRVTAAFGGNSRLRSTSRSASVRVR
jgi:hypothetical protein